MPNTYKLIATLTANGTSSFYQFTSIPQNFTDLKLVVSGRGDTATATTQGFYVQVVGVTSGYSGIYLQYYDNTTRSYSNSGNNAWLEQPLNNAANTANIFNNAEIYIPNYTSSNNKSASFDVVKEQNSSGGLFTYSSMMTGLLQNTSAITALEVGSNITAPNWTTGSTFSLYGIKNS
jgi:hypothetical protein